MTGVSDAYDRSHRANNTFKHGGDFLLTRVTPYSKGHYDGGYLRNHQERMAKFLAVVQIALKHRLPENEYRDMFDRYRLVQLAHNYQPGMVFPRESYMATRRKTLKHVAPGLGLTLALLAVQTRGFSRLPGGLNTVITIIIILILAGVYLYFFIRSRKGNSLTRDL